MIQNKLLINFLLGSGCKQDDEEVSISWNPINFQIYSDLFIELIELATTEWLSDNKLETDVLYEVVFAHVIESDYFGAVHTEYFEPLIAQSREL